MAEHNELGKKGEELASKHLHEKGYSILSRNYRFAKAEIDLIAEKDGFVIFVEVKTRAGFQLEDPELSVTRKKQAQIIKAAANWFRETDSQSESRFDIITVVFEGNKVTLNHIEEAFYPMMKRR